MDFDEDAEKERVEALNWNELRKFAKSLGIKCNKKKLELTIEVLDRLRTNCQMSGQCDEHLEEKENSIISVQEKVADVTSVVAATEKTFVIDGAASPSCTMNRTFTVATSPTPLSSGMADITTSKDFQVTEDDTDISRLDFMEQLADDTTSSFVSPKNPETIQKPIDMEQGPPDFQPSSFVSSTPLPHSNQRLFNNKVAPLRENNDISILDTPCASSTPLTRFSVRVNNLNKMNTAKRSSSVQISPIVAFACTPNVCERRGQFKTPKRDIRTKARTTSPLYDLDDSMFSTPGVVTRKCTVPQMSPRLQRLTMKKMDDDQKKEHKTTYTPKRGRFQYVDTTKMKFQQLKEHCKKVGCELCKKGRH